MSEWRGVKVVPYNSEWPIMFEQEKKVLQAILSDLLVEIHHIGSTAIPGISAKPVIDILPVVKEIVKVDEMTKEFERYGYEGRGEFGLPGRRYFTKGKSERTHHIHIYERGNPEVIRHLAFRDYMIAHPLEAKAYSELKEKLAKEFANDRDSYIDGKEEFVKERERRALLWRDSK
ncbi:MAG: GrpB family protein [Candidatus Thorarchaeota archaeon]